LSTWQSSDNFRLCLTFKIIVSVAVMVPHLGKTLSYLFEYKRLLSYWIVWQQVFQGLADIVMKHWDTLYDWYYYVIPVCTLGIFIFHSKDVLFILYGLHIGCWEDSYFALTLS